MSSNIVINREQIYIQRRINQIKKALKSIKDEYKDDEPYDPFNALDRVLNKELTELTAKLNPDAANSKKVIVRGFVVKTRASGRKKDHHRKKKSDTKVKKIIGHKKSSKNIKVKKNKTRRKKNQSNKK
jgi:predicted RNA-binding protein with PUA domain